MRSATTKRRLRVMVCLVLATSVTLALWTTLTQERGEAYIEVLSVTADLQNDDYIVDLRLHNESNQRLVIYCLPPITPQVSFHSVDSHHGNTSVFHQYILEGKVVPSNIIYHTDLQIIAPGETRDITAGLIASGLPKGRVKVSSYSFPPSPWWADLYALIPKAWLPEKLKDRIARKIRRIDRIESEPFRVQELATDSAP